MAKRKPFFPEDEYTPNGYLDNPFHTYKLNQSGVIRSKPAMGFGWHFPHLGRGYGRRIIYSSHLNIGVIIDGKAFLDFSDFRKHDVRLCSRYHSKNLVSFDFEYSGITVSVKFCQPCENSISAVVELHNTGSLTKEVSLFAVNNYTRYKDTSGFWEEGLTGNYDPNLDGIQIKAYSEGTIMITRADIKSAGYGLFTNDAGAGEYIRGICMDFIPQPHLAIPAGESGRSTITGVLKYDLTIPRRGRSSTSFILGRGETDKAVQSEAQIPSGSGRSMIRNKIHEDDRFWENAVHLEGDFPEHWRRGFVYDTETLRMNIRKPAGIYKHVWDAMQIQAPRAVLAEACFDAILISYSDPDTAKELLFGTFDDSPEYWVPCTREDGSYNMIAWNGFPCGTAPEWGAPLWVVELVYRRTKDKRWLRKIYPLLVSYITWWLNNRTDEEGYAHYLCSYESGQDMSERFGHQLGGGYDVTHIRAVDLMAAMCDSLYCLQFFAEELGKDSAVKKWEKLAGEYEEKTQSLWCKDGWYHDYDRNQKKFTDGYDIMHLGPFFYSIADEHQCESVRSKIRALCLGSRPHWATFTLMLVESAFNTGLRKPLAIAANKLVEYIYSVIDAREQGPAMPLPGVQHEFWPMSRTWGAEGYGWGCFSVFLVLRTIFGYRESGEDEDSFMLCPSIPKEMIKSGKQYIIRNLKYRKMVFDLKCSCVSDREMEFEIEFTRGISGAKVKITDYNTAQLHFDGDPARTAVKFHPENYSDYLIALY